MLFPVWGLPIFYGRYSRGDFKIVPILAGVTFNAVFVALLEPSYKATVTDLLSEEEFDKASGMVQMAGNAKYLISPALAGVLLGIAAGMIVTELIGERIFGTFFSLLGLGIEKISFADASLAMYVILFGSLFLVLAVSTLISVRQMKKIPVTDCFYV